jgi:DNA-binding transcriptional LysR family regulator
VNRLNAMELFAASVRHGSFSEAGRRSGLSPASVSRLVGELEVGLGVQLLNRTSRSLSLTEAGQAYLRRIEPILEGIRHAEAEAGAFQRRPSGTLRVHSRLMFGNRILARLIPGFQTAYPDIKIELHLAERPANLSQRDSDIDIEIRIGRPRDLGLKQRLILPSERILVASPAYLDQAPPVEMPVDLQQHRCLAYWIGPEEPVWRFSRNGMLEEIAISSPTTTNSGEVLRILAIEGHGIALLDDYTVQPDIHAGRLRRLLADVAVTNASFEYGHGIYAVFRQADFIPAKIQVFLEYLTVRRIHSLTSLSGMPNL